MFPPFFFFLLSKSSSILYSPSWAEISRPYWLQILGGGHAKYLDAGSLSTPKRASSWAHVLQERRVVCEILKTWKYRLKRCRASLKITPPGAPSKSLDCSSVTRFLESDSITPFPLSLSGFWRRLRRHRLSCRRLRCAAILSYKPSSGQLAMLKTGSD